MRFDVQSQQRDQDIPNGDTSFRGLRMKTPREALEAGYYSRGENKRIGRGLETRPGTRTPLFANLFAGQTLLGSGVYSNPNGDEMGLLVLAGIFRTVVAIRAGTLPINIPVQGTFTGKVEFTQHFDKILAHQDDPSLPTFVWDGIDYDTGFVELTGPGVVGPGFAAMPNPPWSINFLDRAWFPVPGEPDQFGASDENDVTTWDSILHKFRINTGTADAIVGAYPFFESSIIIGKRRSIDVLKNIPQDLGDSFIRAAGDPLLSPSSAPPPRVSVISTEVGILARKSGVMAGGRFMFLSDAGPSGGIYQITTDQHGQYIVDPTPVSDEIEPVIQRINWPYAQLAVGTTNGRYAQWAVPLDGATFNNAMLVLNLATGEWESVDLWRALPRTKSITYDNPMRMDNVFRLDFYGSSQLFAVNNSAAKVHLLYQGLDDQLELGNVNGETQTYPIQDLMETRGYLALGGGNETEQRAMFIEFALGTLAPNISFEQMVDGDDGDESDLGLPFLPNRTRYKTGRNAYLIDNIKDDSDASGREDYSVQIGDAVLLHDDGVRIQRVRPWVHRVSLHAQGRFLSFRVSNSGGICQVRSILYVSNTTRAKRAA